MKVGWEEKTLVEVCENIFAGGDKPKDNFSPSKTEEFHIPIFSNGEKNNGLYGFTNIPKVIKPSITVSARGTIGFSVIRHEAFYPIVRLIVLTPNTDIVSLEFLKYVIGSIDFKNSGSSIPQLTVPMIKKYKAIIPPLQEQKQIVEVLNKLIDQVKDSKEKYNQQLYYLEELKISILHKALAGELTSK